MADISIEIQALKEAEYGEEVRGAFVSCMEKINQVSEDTEKKEELRVDAESKREEAEENRRIAESLRAEAEEARRSAESNRDSAESKKKQTGSRQSL